MQISCEQETTKDYTSNWVSGPLATVFLYAKPGCSLGKVFSLKPSNPNKTLKGIYINREGWKLQKLYWKKLRTSRDIKKNRKKITLTMFDKLKVNTESQNNV